MLDKNNSLYSEIIAKYNMPYGVNIPRCICEWSEEEINERLLDVYNILENNNVDEKDAFTIALCKRRSHKAYYVDIPWMSGRAFFFYFPLRDGEMELDINEISFGEADVIVTYFLSAVCQQVERHCHALIVVDTPIRLDCVSVSSPRVGVKVSIVGTNTEITKRYIYSQMADENVFREYSNNDIDDEYREWENPAFRNDMDKQLSFEGGNIYPIDRDIRLAYSTTNNKTIQITNIQDIKKIPYPTSSIFIFKNRQQANNYNCQPVVIVKDNNVLYNLLNEMKRTRDCLVVNNNNRKDYWIYYNLRLIIIGKGLEDVLKLREEKEDIRNMYYNYDSEGSHDVYLN